MNNDMFSGGSGCGPGPASMPESSDGMAAKSTGLEDVSMEGGVSLDDIMQNNSAELHRRMGLSQPPFSNPMISSEADSRTSMVNFGSTADSLGAFPYTGLQFAGHPTQSTFIGDGTTVGNMMDFGGSSTAFTGSQAMLDMSAADYSPISPTMLNNPGLMQYPSLDMSQLSHDPAAMAMYASSTLNTHFQSDSLDPVSSDFNAMDMNTERPDMAGAGLSSASVAASMSMGIRNTGEGMLALNKFNMTDADNMMQRSMELAASTQAIDATLGTYSTQGLASGMDQQHTSSFQPPMHQTATAVQSEMHRPPTAVQDMAGPRAGDAQMHGPPPPPAKNYSYSKSGFDMLRALWYVATRKNPKISLGAVDMSCSFVVCDVTQNDCPIMYVSDNFQNLTGYSRHDILGKNCRFLQAPGGNVEGGSWREYVDNAAVLNIKKKLEAGEEVQQSLINYRRCGTPFLNLLTMIPIPWDSDEIRYIVGFQIDLVESPGAISARDANSGTFSVDYARHEEVQCIWHPPARYHQAQLADSTGATPGAGGASGGGQTLSSEDVSLLLQHYNAKSDDMSEWQRQSWDRMLLENTDDVVHVLSLKGIFLYVSPSCKAMLGYEPSELIHRNLDHICHPSDITTVIRDLKEVGSSVGRGESGAAGKTANLVYRIRSKNEGYIWFECHGSLLQEQGKGRKYIILVGRRRPVYSLSRRQVAANGGIGANEFWTKLSTSGLFLFVSSNVRDLLEIEASSLVGTSIQELMRKKTRQEFGRAVEKARNGKAVRARHELLNKRGQVLQAETFLYPGEEVRDGRTCSFLLGQTRVIRQSPRMAAMAAEAGAATFAAAVADAEPASTGDATASTADGSGGGSGSEPLTAEERKRRDQVNIFIELLPVRSSSWQFELRRTVIDNKNMAEKVRELEARRKKRKRRKGSGAVVLDCANCHTRTTPEWRRGPSGQRDLCNSCGLRYAKQVG